MHRSGTSLVSGMLSCMGAFMDPAWPRVSGSESIVPPGPLVRRNGYGEATAFRLLNERLLHWAGAEWDDPTEFLKQRDSNSFEGRCLRAIRTATFTALRTGYLNQAPARRLEVWGWKDPRSSLTLPFWLQAFPDARILHVRRNSDAIVESLMKREQSKELAAAPSSLSARISRVAANPRLLIDRMARRLAPDSRRPAPHAPLDRDRAYRLVDEYVSECLRYRALGSRYEEVHYEDILIAPRTLASRIAEFGGVAASGESISNAASFVTQPDSSNTVKSSQRSPVSAEEAPR